MVLDNLRRIRDRVDQAARRSGRDPDSVKVVAVTKYAKLEGMKALLESGLIQEIGENRVQEAAAKKAALGPLAQKAKWRLIGHLQTNKAKKALGIFDVIDSLDSVELADILEKLLIEQSRRLPILVQVKLTSRQQQSGLALEALGEVLAQLQARPHLDIRGLMAIAPAEDPVEKTRPHFRRLRQAFEQFFGGRAEAQLSMGMSRDFEIAIEEGATHVRIGSLLFA
ncbi:MAG: YggS family pyridoxal phosphate-dependent enzyme [Elusimicrobia bacterium]|nr:YggS family pyridoxal phosphate-dependent enzyme [Elusimicrobiota bacterium]